MTGPIADAQRNVEFKAELLDLAAARVQCKQLGGQRIGTLRQTDTYFRLAEGRLKRREAPGEPTEWIFYNRPDRVRPKLSHYSIMTEGQARRRWGEVNLHPWVTVVKTRELWLIGDVRIHLDEVDDLGRFIEFEAVISRTFDVEAGHAEVVRLREVFGPILGEAVAVSYADLMSARS